jgi:hypothetical protein
MNPQDTLARRISTRASLTDDERTSLVKLLGSGCHQRTKNMLWYSAGYVPDVPSYGIYDRVTFEDGRASYCAGQSYPDEIRTVRKLLLGR